MTTGITLATYFSWPARDVGLQPSPFATADGTAERIEGPDAFTTRVEAEQASRFLARGRAPGGCGTTRPTPEELLDALARGLDGMVPVFTLSRRLVEAEPAGSLLQRHVNGI